MIPLAFIFETLAGATAAAAAAVSVPIIIHLLNRRRFRVVTWAAMQFLLAAQKKNSRRMRIEQLLLLLLRCCLVLFLVLAMAAVMPWAETIWRGLFPESIAAAVPAQGRTYKLLVLDGSFSMAAREGDQSAFDRAKKLAAQVVTESPRGDSFGVVLMAGSARRIVSEPSEDPRKVLAELEKIRLPHGNADVPGTLNTVEDMLRQAPGKFQTREVYFFTDLQRSTWTGGQTPGTALATVVQKIQSVGQTVFVDVGLENDRNVAVTGLFLNASVATTGTLTPITAILHNYGSQTREQVRVELLVGKARAEAGDAPFELRVAHQLVPTLSRGQNAVTFPYRFTSPGDYVLQVRVENDNLELDDVRSATITVKDSIPVLLVNGKLASGLGSRLADDATEWVRIALDPTNGKGGLGGLPIKARVISEREFNDPGQGDLTPYDVVFLADVRQFTPAEAKRLETHLRRGGGVVFSLGDQVDVGAYNDVLYRNGAGLLPARLIGKQTAPKDWFFTFGVEGKSYSLPPLDAFTDDDDRIALLTSRFRQYIRTETAPRGGPRKILTFLPALTPGLKPPAKPPELPVGDPALVEWKPLVESVRDPSAGGPRQVRTRGQVLLVTTTLNMDWNSWPISPSFPALMQEMLAFSVAGRLREHSLSVGEPIEEYLQSTGGGLDVTIQTPDERTAVVQSQPHEDVSVFRWADTDVSGIYRATVGAHPREHLYAVNVPTSTDAQAATESDPARTTDEELRKHYADWNFQLITDLKDVVHHSGSESATEYVARPLGPAIARFLLLGVLVLLLLEVILAWRFGHYTSGGGTVNEPPATGKLAPALALLFTVGVLGVMGLILGHAAWTGDFLSFLPERLRGVLERVAGIEAPAAGEASRWRLESMVYFWDSAADPWLAGALAVVAAVLFVWVYQQEGSTASIGYKLVLAGLRLGLLLTTLVVLLPQLRVWFERQGWPDVVLILDDSQSMSTVDRYRDPDVQAAADRLGKLTDISEPQRLQLAQALVTRGKTDWLTTLVTQRKVKVHVYHASARAHRIADVTSPEEVGPALERIRELRADPANDSSQLGAVVRQVLNDFRGASLAAIITLTDGVTTEGEDLVKVASYAKQTGVPLFFVGIGDQHEMRDLALHDLQAEDSVYVKDRIVFEVRLTGHGYSDLNVPVQLFEKGKDQPLKEERVRVDPMGKPVKVRLVYQPEEPGEKVFVIKVPIQPDERNPDNNKLERTVYVRETKLIKVLYVEGYPRWEYRYIKTLLERESARTKGNKTVDLKVLLLDADPDYAAQDRSALSEFPTKTELNGYDVVFLGDVDPKHPKLGDKNLQALADFVQERGGGLLMIAGQRSAPHLFGASPLRDVLPVEVVRGEGPEEPVGGRTDPYRPDLTPMGRLHPIFRFSPDERENDEIWNRLREMYWYSEGYRVKPAAEVLAVHPRHKPRPEERGLRSEEGHPLVVQHFVGAGRALFFGFDETWRWRFREDELRFNQFWIQTVRYLARSRLGRVELRLDRQTPYRRGEPIKMTVRFPDDKAPPDPATTKVKVVVERRPLKQPGEDVKGGQPAEVQVVQLTEVKNSRSTFEGLLTRTPEGEYQFWLSEPGEPLVSPPKPRAEAKVLAPPGEMELLRMNQADMERAAEETRGQFYNLADADRLLGDLPAGTRVSLNSSGPPWLLWNHWLVFGVALGFLTLEWILRKRKHLL